MWNTIRSRWSCSGIGWSSIHVISMTWLWGCEVGLDTIVLLFIIHHVMLVEGPGMSMERSIGNWVCVNSDYYHETYFETVYYCDFVSFKSNIYDYECQLFTSQSRSVLYHIRTWTPNTCSRSCLMLCFDFTWNSFFKAFLTHGLGPMRHLHSRGVISCLSFIVKCRMMNLSWVPEKWNTLKMWSGDLG